LLLQKKRTKEKEARKYKLMVLLQTGPPEMARTDQKEQVTNQRKFYRKYYFASSAKPIKPNLRVPPGFLLVFIA
jgi:hypothetical protein